MGRPGAEDSNDEDQLFSRSGQVLVTLISEFRMDAASAGLPGATGQHEELLLEKRRELLNHIFLVLKKQHKNDAWTL